MGIFDNWDSLPLGEIADPITKELAILTGVSLDTRFFWPKGELLDYSEFIVRAADLLWLQRLQKVIG